MTWLSRLLGSEHAGRRAPTGDPDHVRAVQAVLDEIRPLLALDGGNFELVAVEDGWVSLHALGACAGCHAQATTLSQAVEARLRERCAWVRGVRSV
ncbi:MAG: NifU family protein [Planctomycetota bacterium]